jgi:NADPH-dependent curcumin reductase CurA
MQSTQCILTSYPTGLPTSENFTTHSVSVSTELQMNQVLVKLVYVSLDPYLRIRLKPVQTSGYFPPFELGKPMTSMSIAQVLKSSNDQIQQGDYVLGMLPWQHVQVTKDVTKIENDDKVPLEKYLSLLGGTGMTAYFGLLEITHPKAGEVVLVSAASGATGSIVCQIAKIKGCTVIGIAGSDEKCKYLKEKLHVDEVINYKTCGSIGDAIAKAAPNGIDIYFDNVGGETLDAAIVALKNFGRISLCGQISSYNTDQVEYGPRLLMNLVTKNARMEGFLASRWLDRFPDGQHQMKKWYEEGLIQSEETILPGPLSRIPDTLNKLLSGYNVGKMIHQVTDNNIA